jgi:hypothetical protein
VTESVSYERICGTVASLLLLFARIENEAREIIARGGRGDSLSKIIGAGGSLQVWKAIILEDGTARGEEALLAEACGASCNQLSIYVTASVMDWSVHRPSGRALLQC